MQEQAMISSAFVWDAGKRAFDALVSSTRALWSATAVWLAVAVLFIGGFVLGHLEASHGKRELRDRTRASESRSADAIRERDMAVAEARDLKARLADLEKKMAAAAESNKKRR